MRGVRIPHDLNGQDRFALGLSVGNLAILLFGLLAAYAVIHVAAPLLLRGFVGTVILAVTLAIVWIRPEGRSLIHWMGAAIAYALSQRTDLRIGKARVASSRLTVLPDPSVSRVREPADDDAVLELPTADHEPIPPDLAGDEPPVPVYLGGPQVIVFYSVKGGTGRTTIATEVACLLAARGRYRETPRARARRLDVMLADLDRCSANVSVRVGLVQPTLLDYLADFTASPDKLSDFVVRHEASNLQVLLGSPKCLAVPDGPSLGAGQASELVSALRSGGHQFIVIDLSASLGDFETKILEMADRIVCVVTPTAAAIQDLYRAVEILRRLGHGSKLAYVANKMHERWDFSEPMGDLGGQLITQIPYDRGFDVAENRHDPYVLRGKGSVEAALVELATFMYPALQSPGLSAPTPGWLPWFGRRRRAG
jgi:MinD-like ATPase involved in chromosome partitioning or flagellar assembly